MEIMWHEEAQLEQSASNNNSANEGAIQSHPMWLVLCSIQEQRSSVAVLLAGTSGTGKSTLAGLLAARLGITTVLSTDNIRHMLRSFAAEDQNPLLWASTYQVRTRTGYGLQLRSCVMM